MELLIAPTPEEVDKALEEEFNNTLTRRTSKAEASKALKNMKDVFMSRVDTSHPQLSPRHRGRLARKAMDKYLLDTDQLDLHAQLTVFVSS